MSHVCQSCRVELTIRPKLCGLKYAWGHNGRISVLLGSTPGDKWELKRLQSGRDIHFYCTVVIILYCYRLLCVALPPCAELCPHASGSVTAGTRPLKVSLRWGIPTRAAAAFSQRSEKHRSTTADRGMVSMRPPNWGVGGVPGLGGQYLGTRRIQTMPWCF